MKNLRVELSKDSYNVYIKRGALGEAGSLLNLKRRVLIVTDDGVPAQYAKALAAECESPVIVTLPQGEGSKTAENALSLCSAMLQNNFSRSDCVAAVGGGVVGDMAGFAASLYMRGIDFYNIPTTLLSQVDSSIGGKTAVDFMGVKNIVGSFYQPRAVLIDADVLKTLPERQFSNGLAEAVKMAATFDRELFEFVENSTETEIKSRIEFVIGSALMIKRRVVEADEKEQGLRRALNFGHTLGHAVESSSGLGALLHGECVAVGMPPMCSKEVRQRLIPLLEKLKLPITANISESKLIELLRHDKKAQGEKITAVLCDEIGSFRFEKLSPEELSERFAATGKEILA